MELIEINPYYIDPKIIGKAVNCLKKGEIIIFPTDTIYAMGCDLMNKKAIKQLARLKQLKTNKINFSLLCSDLSDLSKYVKQIDRSTYKLLKHHLPGPFTFIMNAANEIPRLFETNKREVGIRIPDNDIVLSLIQSLGNPIVASSLNNDNDEIQPYFFEPMSIYQKYQNDVSMIIDGGNGSLEGSTVVDCRNGKIDIIRQGKGIIE
jgi:tRNA threonylcarbamoyl adenosine modification protein (Sua5/YciO/YrdC/YwlC family)